jgi:hypothetical protein
MPHISLIAFTGFRVVDPELRALGMSLPGLRRRGEAIAALPALGLLTVAAHTPEHWTQSYHDAPAFDDALAERIAAEGPALVAISALTASIEEAYALCAALRGRGVATVIGGLHATALPDEVLLHADAAAVGDGETAWRVWLMIRVARVWAGRSQPGAALVVLLYGDVVLLLALIVSPWPVIDFMAGNTDPAATAEFNIRLLVSGLAFIGLPLLLLASLVHLFTSRDWRGIRKVPVHLIHRPAGKPALRSLWLLTAASCLVWAPVLPFTQAELKDKPTRAEIRQQQREEERRNSEDDPG